MLKIGITGVDGLLGWHFRCYLHGQPETQAIPAGRTTFDSLEALDAFVKQCDAIVHLAGMNRGDEDVVSRTNVALVHRLIGALRKTDARPQVLFSSSTHIYGETRYGRSKRECGDLLRAWAKSTGARFTNMILPNIFGEGGRPFYNSAVSTMCYQLADDQPNRVIQDREIELLHAQRLAEDVLRLIATSVDDEIRLEGARMRVSTLQQRLQELHDSYRGQVIPDLREPLQLDLFNTYRSYLFPHKYPFATVLRSDQRGDLFEVVRDKNGGQVFMSTTRPGITRGNHYHRRKVERFCVVRGDASIRVRRLFDGKVHEFFVSGNTPQFIDIPTLHTHSITNTGTGELLTLFWAHEIFDPRQPDTVGALVEPGEGR